MTDEELDRLVRDADPYRPDVVGRLGGARRILLEEIMSVPTLEPVGQPPQTPQSPQPSQPTGRAGRRLARRLVAPVAAAAVVAGLLVVSTMAPEQPDGGQEAATTPGASTGTARAGTGSAGTGSAGAPVAYSPVALQAAEENPRLLIDQPGWRVTTVYGFAEKQGTISFDNGGRQLEMNWYPADQYDGYHADRLTVSRPEPVTVDSWPGDVFTYSASDFAVMLRPRDGVFVELRTGGGWTRPDFNQALTKVVRVDVPTWLAALPPEIVTPGRADAAAAEILADVPLPPNFDTAALAGLGTNDSYQFGAEVTSRVGCAWIAEWLRAKRADDDAALRRAADALRGSHNWRVLREMQDDGGWSDVFWETADKVAAGHPPKGYADGLGCD